MVDRVGLSHFPIQLENYTSIARIGALIYLALYARYMTYNVQAESKKKKFVLIRPNRSRGLKSGQLFRLAGPFTPSLPFHSSLPPPTLPVPSHPTHPLQLKRDSPQYQPRLLTPHHSV